MKSVPRAAVAWVVFTVAVAVVLVLVSSRSSGPVEPVGVVIAGIVAVLVGLIRTRVSDQATISLGFVVVFWSLIHLGPQEAVLVAALNGVSVVLLPKSKEPLTSLVGIHAVAMLVVIAWMAGLVYQLAGGEPGSIGVRNMAVPAASAVLTYHLVNCALVALIAGLSTKKSIWQAFRMHLAMSALSYYAGAGLAVLAHVAWQAVGPWPVFAALPLALSLQMGLHHVRAPATYQKP